MISDLTLSLFRLFAAIYLFWMHGTAAFVSRGCGENLHQDTWCQNWPKKVSKDVFFFGKVAPAQPACDITLWRFSPVWWPCRSRRYHLSKKNTSLLAFFGWFWHQVSWCRCSPHPSLRKSSMRAPAGRPHFLERLASSGCDRSRGLFAMHARILKWCWMLPLRKTWACQVGFPFHELHGLMPGKHPCPSGTRMPAMHALERNNIDWHLAWRQAVQFQVTSWRLDLLIVDTLSCDSRQLDQVLARLTAADDQDIEVEPWFHWTMNWRPNWHVSCAPLWCWQRVQHS